MGCCESCMRDQHPAVGNYNAIPDGDVGLTTTGKKRINNDVFQGVDDDDHIRDHDHLEKLYASNGTTPIKSDHQDSFKEVKTPVEVSPRKSTSGTPLESPGKAPVTPLKTAIRESILPISASTPTNSEQSSLTPSPAPVTPPVRSPFKAPTQITEFSPMPVTTKDTFDGISPQKENPTPARLSVSSILSANSVHVPPVSAPVTHNSREFRIFLPHIDDVLDKPWITRDVTTSYKDALQIVTLAALNGNNTPEPQREDSYVVGKPYYGLKYRAGSKLELKVRTMNKPIWMEKWSKVKFGKKKLTKYKSDILTHLTDVGFGVDAAANDEILENPRYLTITKSRNAWRVKNVVVEVVEISIATKQEKFDEPIKRKKWLSIAVEGDSLSIEEFILHSQASLDLFKCFTIARHIYASNPSRALSCNFVPIVSGYPMWIRLCGNKVNQEEVDKEISPSVDALMSFLK